MFISRYSKSLNVQGVLGHFFRLTWAWVLFPNTSNRLRDLKKMRNNPLLI